MTETSNGPSVDQPEPGSAQATQGEPFVMPEMLGEHRIIAIDAIIAETYGEWERRRLPVDSKGTMSWMWRPPRDPKQKGSAEWQPRPPPFCGTHGPDPHVTRLADSVSMQRGLDFVLTTRWVDIQHGGEATTVRGYMVGFGKNTDGSFRGDRRLRAFAWPQELACALLLTKLAGIDPEQMHRDLFLVAPRQQ